jgi:hypothetical protein
MSIFPKLLHGHYDEKGQWQRDKFCFVACPPEKCDCMPRHNKDLTDNEWDSLTKGRENE